MSTIPRSLKTAVKNAHEEKLSAMNTAAFFEKHRARANRTTFRRILNRKGGEAPRPGDEL